MPAFFIPTDTGLAGEHAYQELRRRTEREMGRAPNQRRIVDLWSRRGNLDCHTTVGAPDPVTGEIVTAIFDMGVNQPFIIYHQHPTDHQAHQASEVLGSQVYAVSEFGP